jgi:hypothetical protein
MAQRRLSTTGPRDHPILGHSRNALKAAVWGAEEMSRSEMEEKLLEARIKALSHTVSRTPAFELLLLLLLHYVRA